MFYLIIYIYVRSFQPVINIKPINEILCILLLYSVFEVECGCHLELSGKESTYQCNRCGFDPWVGKSLWKKK